MLLMLQALMMFVIWALNDRFAGGGDPPLDDALPGRAVFWAALAGFVVSAACGMEMWLAMSYSLAWLAWRTPPWKLIPGSSTTPTGFPAIMATFVRHSLMPVAMTAVAWMFHKDPWHHFLVFSCWAAFATMLSALYGQYTTNAKAHPDDMPHIIGGDFNVWVELSRGAAFGVTLWFASH